MRFLFYFLLCVWAFLFLILFKYLFQEVKLSFDIDVHILNRHEKRQRLLYSPIIKCDIQRNSLGKKSSHVHPSRRTTIVTVRHLSKSRINSQTDDLTVCTPPTAIYNEMKFDLFLFSNSCMPSYIVLRLRKKRNIFN